MIHCFRNSLSAPHLLLAAACLLAACSSSRVEPNAGRRSILVEPEVNEYLVEVSTFGNSASDGSFEFYFGGLLPRRRLSENWEWMNFPMPLFKYRMLRADRFELAAHGGLPYLPFLGVLAHFHGDSVRVTGVLPQSLRIGLEGKLRASELVYIHLFELNQFGFSGSEASANLLEATLGIQAWDRNSLEFGARHIHPYGKGRRLRGGVDFTAGPKISGFTHIHWHPYYAYHLPLGATQSAGYSKFGSSLTWFW